MTNPRAAATRKRFSARLPARSGRPPRENAGEVDERILDAAQRVFLDRGFEGASIEEIAEVGRAGKPTIYARHAGKKELFAAVVLRNVARTVRYVETPSAEASLEERLQTVGLTILDRALNADTVGLFRTTIAEARRFPELSPLVSKMARERGLEALTRLLTEMAERGELGSMHAFDPARLQTTARIFLDLIVIPFVMRALFGDSLESLRAEVAGHVSSRVFFFLAACRQSSSEDTRPIQSRE
jgi:AcrR family transcriptional regulator